jgi:four helix bundle protein
VPRPTFHGSRIGTEKHERAAEVAVLPHEGLEVYGVALEMHSSIARIAPTAVCRDLKDQVDRASTSVVLNIAEGAGRFSRREKRRFFEIARASATEVAAVVDILKLRGAAPRESCQTTRNLAVRVVQMLSRLTTKMRLGPPDGR